MLIYLDSEKCGSSYNSCISDPTKTNKVAAIAKVLIVFLGIAICIGSCLNRIRRRQQARERFHRQIQALVDQSQQQMIIHVIDNPSVFTSPLIQEEIPPTYEQVTETRQSKNES
jgi:hypothetical protein